MAAVFDGMFTSKLCVFVVGEHKAPITVHAAIIACQSQALNVLINGEMIEARTGTIGLDDVQEDTFIRFCQFAYTGDYGTPAFILQPEAELPHQPSVVISPSFTPVCYDGPSIEKDDFVFEEARPKKSKNTSKKCTLRESFDRKFYDIETARSISTARCRARQNSSPAEDYAPVFLGHARLYSFAEKWGIESLKTLSLYKLHRTLITFTTHAARRRDIVELLRYAYSDDNTPDLVHGVDELRSLVMLYVTCEVESLIYSPEFLFLIEQGGSLSRDLVQMMMKRIG